MRCTFPMVDLTWTVLTFCHPFLRREIRKLIEIVAFCLICSSVMATLPTATPIHRTFFSWNLTLDLTSSIFLDKDSAWVMAIGNLLILFRIGPKILVSCLTIESVHIRTWYFLAHFLMSFLTLLKALSPSISLTSIPSIFFASSKWAWSPITQILSLGRGTNGSLTDPANRLSFCGS